MACASFTYKQLEAIYWIVELNGFQPAADRLHTTQSAISKRVQELEAGLGLKIFDRGGHAARLTDKGQEFWQLARQLLQQRDDALSHFQAAPAGPRLIRLGVSELTAATWLPQFVKRIQLRFPAAQLQPDVDLAVIVADMLKAGQLDLAILPQVLLDDRFSQIPVGMAEHVWVCKPSLLRASGPMDAGELAGQTLLIQRPDRSATVRLLANWAHTQQVGLERAVRCNSISALMGMALSGLGIAYVPRAFAQPHVHLGALHEVVLRQPPEPVVMCAAFRPQPQGHFVHVLADIAMSCCSFTRVL